MSEWGIPDWRSKENYGEVQEWGLNRWFWEFLRRRSDLRLEFDSKKHSVHELALERARLLDNDSLDAVLSPEQAGFYVGTKNIHQDDPDFIEKLPNPRIAVQPYWASPMLHDHMLQIRYDDVELPGGRFDRIDFDLDRPLRPQIETAAAALKEAQEHRHGKTLQSRRFPQKWLTYLRVLDAREDGASWSEIAEFLEHTSGTPQTARDIHLQARALCFNF